MDTLHPHLSLPPLLHIGHVVRDLQATAGQLAEMYGFVPDDTVFESEPDNTDDFLGTFDLHITGARVRGEPASFGARFGFMTLGTTQLELIQPLEGASPYTMFLESAGGGLHHLAFVVPSIDERLRQWTSAGMTGTVLLDAPLPNGGRIVNVENLPGNLIVELIQRG